MWTSRPVLEGARIEAGLSIAPQPHVAALPTDAGHAAQLCDVDTTTLRFIPSPLPLETELDALVHDIALSPLHGLASRARLSSMSVGNAASSITYVRDLKCHACT